VSVPSDAGLPLMHIFFPPQTFMTVLIKRKQLALQAQAKKQNKESGP
jgi:hypothetical protein